jgi:hypothetical protein
MNEEASRSPKQRELLERLKSLFLNERFAEVLTQNHNLLSTIEGLEKEWNELARGVDRANEELTARFDELTTARDEALTAHDLIKQQRDEAIAQRDSYAYRLLKQRDSEVSTPVMKTDSEVKTTKMPDAPMLSDGKKLRFQTWEAIIRQKLAANADHYPEPVHRMLYVQSRCEGEAQLHLAPRLGSDSTSGYKDADDMIMHLKSVLANPYRANEAALAEYQVLKMKPRELFSDFLEVFMQLAREAQNPHRNMKRDLQTKLLNLLMNQVWESWKNEDVTFDHFTQVCQRISHAINSNKVHELQAEDERPQPHLHHREEHCASRLKIDQAQLEAIRIFVDQLSEKPPLDADYPSHDLFYWAYQVQRRRKVLGDESNLT